MLLTKNEGDTILISLWPNLSEKQGKLLKSYKIRIFFKSVFSHISLSLVSKTLREPEIFESFDIMDINEIISDLPVQSQM